MTERSDKFSFGKTHIDETCACPGATALERAPANSFGAMADVVEVYDNILQTETGAEHGAVEPDRARDTWYRAIRAVRNSDDLHTFHATNAERAIEHLGFDED